MGVGRPALESMGTRNICASVKNCKTCAQTITAKGNLNFCSGDCYFKWRRENFRHSEKTKKLMSESRSNEKHPFWKGEKVGYFALHRWIRSHFGKPESCEECGKINTPSKDGRSSVHWANLDGNYDRVRVNWKSMCVPCHRKLDGVLFGKPYGK